MTLSAAHRSPSRCHSHTEADRSSALITTPANPQAFDGSCAGRSSSTIWWASPRSMRWVSLRSDMLQKFKWCPNFRPSRSSGFSPSSIIDGRAPLRRDHCVLAQMPPHVVREVLRSSVLLPRPDHLERVVVEQCDAAGPVVAVRPAQRGHEDAARPAVHGVRPRVSGLGGEFAGLNRVRQHRVSRVGFGVEDIRVRRPDAGDEEVAPLECAWPSWPS